MSSHKENFGRIKRYESDTGKHIGIDVEELRQWANNRTIATLPLTKNMPLGGFVFARRFCEGILADEMGLYKSNG